MSRINPFFFKRDSDGSVRVRMRFTREEADIIEEAAGDTPLLPYLYEVINERAEQDAQEARLDRARVVPAPKEASA